MKLEPISAVRPPFVFWTCLWGVGLSFALVLVFRDIVRPDIGNPPGRDFANLYTAGKLALHGSAWEAFNVDLFRLALREHMNMLILQNYSYPPHALFLAVPFAMLPYWPAFMLWTVASAAFFCWAASRWVPFHPVLALVTPAAALNMWNGHYGLLIGALWLIFFAHLHRQPARAGLAAAALTFKPHMGLFIALPALTNWRTLLVAAAGTLALIALSILAFGPSPWFGFIIDTAAAQTEILSRAKSEFYFRLMPSAYVWFGRGALGVAAQVVFAIATLIMLARNRCWDPFILSTATFLIIPYVFIYDMTVACLGFAIILWNCWSDLKKREKAVLVLAFLSPNLTMIAGPTIPFILVAALSIQLRRAEALRPRPSSRPMFSS